MKLCDTVLTGTPYQTNQSDYLVPSCDSWVSPTAGKLFHTGDTAKLLITLHGNNLRFMIRQKILLPFLHWQFLFVGMYRQQG
ncbi:hypothetical protein BaRGS_00012275 [Batillaria attramentaria]|uniref:Uncharacterized protein n=1 Tax=Batillaria attramentaria TaxID=370345 RepID=A0ABD0LAX2_9CAEN